MEGKTHENNSSSILVRTYYLRLKDINPKYSIGLLSRNSGLSLSLLKMILTGRRRVTLKQANKLQVALKLSDQEAAALESLVVAESGLESKSKNLSRRAGFITELGKPRIIRLLDQHLVQPIWMPALVLVMSEPTWADLLINSSAFRKNLAVDFGVTIDQLQSAYEYILRNQNILKQRDGNFFVDLKSIGNRNQKEEVARASLSKQLAFLNKHGLTGNSHFCQWYLSADESSLETLKLEIETVIEKFITRSSALPPDRILHFTFQLTPTVKKI